MASWPLVSPWLPERGSGNGHLVVTRGCCRLRTGLQTVL